MVLWSQGIGRACDFAGPGRYAREPTESHKGPWFFAKHYAGARDLVWVRLGTRSRFGGRSDLEAFVQGALPTIHESFALVTTDGDASVPGDLPPAVVDALLASPWLVSWHTQNHDGFVHPRLRPFPIGLDLHTPRPEGGPRRLVRLLDDIRVSRVPAAEAPLRVFCDLGINVTSDDRSKAIATLGECNHVDVLTSRLSQAEIWTRYAQHAFVLSARGQGLDCHRTWELLYLGCIVIARRSSLDPLYEGLPVVLVDDWGEVRDLDRLEVWHREYADLTDRERVWSRLTPDRWLRPIREAIATARQS